MEADSDQRLKRLGDYPLQHSASFCLVALLEKKPPAPSLKARLGHSGKRAAQAPAGHGDE